MTLEELRTLLIKNFKPDKVDEFLQCVKRRKVNLVQVMPDKVFGYITTDIPRSIAAHPHWKSDWLTIDLI